MEFVSNDTDRASGVMAIQYSCPNCGRRISMVTNPGETQMVSSLGVTIGHETLAEGGAGPMKQIRRSLEGEASWTEDRGSPDPVWTEAAEKRLAAAPGFVQGMVRRLYTDWAKRNGFEEVSPAVMSKARDALGMSEM
ncbi:MAG TPA: hypothetical protein VI520_05325 [Anaerolineales bacterium]|jgi:hypothetical protein|nr:hypothetical protein [Anaerolineales bacterium]